MTLTLVTKPAVQPVTLADMKLHLRVRHPDEDISISGMIDAATQRVEHLGLALITQTWRLTLDTFEQEVGLPRPPLRSVSTISYVDAQGLPQTLPTADYSVAGLGGAGRLSRRNGRAWPTTINEPEAVSVTFVAGFGDAPADVPAPLKMAIKMHVGVLYACREAALYEVADIAEVPFGWESLINDYRTFRF